MYAELDGSTTIMSDIDREARPSIWVLAMVTREDEGRVNI